MGCLITVFQVKLLRYYIISLAYKILCYLYYLFNLSSSANRIEVLQYQKSQYHYNSLSSSKVMSTKPTETTLEVIKDFFCAKKTQHVFMNVKRNFDWCEINKGGVWRKLRWFWRELGDDL